MTTANTTIVVPAASQLTFDQVLARHMPDTCSVSRVWLPSLVAVLLI